MPLTPVLVLAQEMEAPDRAVIATDAAGMIVYWGPGAERMYGWHAREVLNRQILEITPTDMSREEGTSIMEALRAGHPWSGEYQVRDRTGQRFDARVTDLPVHDNAGRLLGIVGISRRRGYTER